MIVDQYRGKPESACPLCQQTEDWLHVLKCCSTTPDKKRLIESIESIPTEEDFEIRLTEKILQQIRDFFYSEHYNAHEIKLLFRGWIRKGEIKKRSKWVQKVIQVLVTFFHEVWTLRNKMKFGHDKRARNKIRKDTLLEKIYNAYDTQEEVFY